MKNKITKNTTLSEILELPGAEKVLMKYRVPCLGCPLASMEMQCLKIGDAAKMYGIKLDGLLKEINELNKEDNKDK